MKIEKKYYQIFKMGYIIYCKHFNVFTDIFKLEYNSWCSNVFRLSKRFRNKNKVKPLSPKGKFETNNFMY